MIGIPVSLWAWNNYSPKPLGDKLEYIGKEDYGCIISFCDSGPSSTYYYATDLNINELAHYFKNAKTENVALQGTNSRKNQMGIAVWFMVFKAANSKIFYIEYYEEGSYVSRDRGLPISKKKCLVSISSRDYQTAESSL